MADIGLTSKRELDILLSSQITLLGFRLGQEGMSAEILEEIERFPTDYQGPLLLRFLKSEGFDLEEFSDRLKVYIPEFDLVGLCKRIRDLGGHADIWSVLRANKALPLFVNILNQAVRRKLYAT